MAMTITEGLRINGTFYQHMEIIEYISGGASVEGVIHQKGSFTTQELFLDLSKGEVRSISIKLKMNQKYLNDFKLMWNNASPINLNIQLGDRGLGVYIIEKNPDCALGTEATIKFLYAGGVLR